jgi:hypothetical protein
MLTQPALEEYAMKSSVLFALVCSLVAGPALSQAVNIKGSLEDLTEAVKANTVALMALREGLAKAPKSAVVVNVTTKSLTCDGMVPGDNPTCVQAAINYCKTLNYGSGQEISRDQPPGTPIPGPAKLTQVVCF